MDDIINEQKSGQEPAYVVLLNKVEIDDTFCVKKSKTTVEGEFADKIPTPTWSGDVSARRNYYIFETKIYGKTSIFWDAWNICKETVKELGFSPSKNGGKWVLKYLHKIDKDFKVEDIKNVEAERDQNWVKLCEPLFKVEKKMITTTKTKENENIELAKLIPAPEWEGFMENDPYKYEFRTKTKNIKKFWPFWKKTKSLCIRKGFNAQKVLGDWYFCFTFKSKKKITEDKILLAASIRDDEWETIWESYLSL